MIERLILKQIRFILLFFMISLFLSGLTAIPVAPELRWVLNVIPEDSALASLLQTVLDAYVYVQEQHNFLLYGYDWLAFAHFVLTLLFVGPYKDPVKNIWVIQFGLLACVLVIPFALVAGAVRGLPIWWRLGDCSFGVVGFAVLWICYQKTKRLQVLQSISSTVLNTLYYENV